MTHREITNFLIKELIDNEIINTDDLQVIHGFDLYAIPEDKLTFPRMIIDFSNYNDSEYHYNQTTYNEESDVVEFQFEKIPRLLYTFRIYNNLKSGESILDILTTIHQFYSNPYQTHSDVLQIVHTGGILNIKSPLDYDYIEAYQFDIEFDISEKTTINYDYVESVDFTINNN